MKRLFSLILLLTALVLLNAYHKKKHFYPMMVYITKSNYSLAVISLQVIMLVSLIGKLFGRLVFGTLTANEVDALRDRGWIIFADSCFTFATFKSDYEPVFAALVYVFLLFKCAHCIAEERLGYMERTPFLSTIFHARMVFIIFFLTCVDIWFVSYSLRHLLTKGVSWQTAFCIEYSIMLLHALNLALNYVAFQLEAHRFVHRVGKEIFLLYSAVIMGILKMALYGSCVGFLLTQNGTPFFLLRHIFSTYDSVKKALLSIILSKKAVRMMDSRFPNATADDLRRFDNVCIICREELTEGEESKVLPCQHIFHRYCLRLWFNRQQNCPTCRRNVLNLVPVPVPVHVPVNDFGAQPNVNSQTTSQPQPGSSNSQNPQRYSIEEIYSVLHDSLKEELISLETTEETSEESDQERSRTKKEELIEKLKTMKKIQRLVDSSMYLMSKQCGVLDDRISVDGAGESRDSDVSLDKSEHQTSHQMYSTMAKSET